MQDNDLCFESQNVLQGIFVDFFIENLRLAIIITEKEHDHGEAYYAEQQEIKSLLEKGFDVIQIPLPDFEKAFSNLEAHIKK